ncbi:flagellar biosynthesis protein FlhF [Clostridium botulinum]|uniref:Flagellar biosynthesis protein FlhF n=1 Tax=Clostridium botulinum C/D str. DC5 TaxID=1443128 RepID=A0A0A0IK77_CLOBO|nr:flagellar biosynthesis protein FlhF [Clostridium botulinum]KGM96628.1 flagellar biosynthesis regulator FlhF [Clostridium botulinum D str. CCUG 7971]KGN01870.1 flagellar biosynthesis regulator FlhF [Clostridium botulinum C/D str. DC5]KOC48506.1 flagellar biosynthesis regulator FlhF [Clostridium botulinum]KOC55682.1 flagellar biosynthesis regulator FlhF [Clostridium botulinum]KOC57589.1 flagellar biosynthesis regulator FlhF [Clostridium botulinum]
MIVKKYLVSSMNEAMNRIRYELGRDAVIINQRKVRRRGFKGLFSPKILEVTAAIDNKKSNNEPMKDSIDAIKKVLEKKEVKPRKEVLPKETAFSKLDNTIQENNTLIKEMQEMKNMISKLSEVTVTSTEIKKSPVEEMLEESDLNKKVITQILSMVQNNTEDIDEKEKVRKAIKDITIINDNKMEGIVVLVGPTGVGKTTTIAKLAGKLALIDKKKVGLITVDTYRIGAIEQLSTYANIMSIPFESVFSIKEMEAALDRMKDCDVVLVDTTGRSSKNIMQIAELNAFVQKTNTENIYLVISATTKDKDVESIVEGYKTLNYANVIITKLDETTTYGSILNILSNANKPLSFVTTGQNVPDDFKKITSEEITRLVLGEDFVC